MDGWRMGRPFERRGPSKGELKAKLHGIATTHYWTTVENNLPLLMAHIEAIGTENSVPTAMPGGKGSLLLPVMLIVLPAGGTPRQIRIRGRLETIA